MLITAAAPALSAASPPAKHLVLVVADDLGYADLGYAGSQIATPNIDKLASAGVKLAHFYVQRACSPTRGALLTGRYNIRYGFQSGVLTSQNNWSLPLDETLLPQFVKRVDARSKCHAVGKWHLGYHRWEHTPTFRGFDSYLGYYSGDEDYYTHQGDCGGFDLHDDSRPDCGAGCSRHAWEAVGEYSTHLFTRRAVSIIREHDAAAPLFLYLPYQAVHDNGAATPACGGWTGGQNWPLRGGKVGAGIARSQRGTTAAGIVHTVDAGSELDGVSQWPMLSRGGAGARQTVLLEADPLASPYSNRPPGFVCSGDQHATRHPHTHGDQHATPYYALRQGRWKLLLGDPGADDNRHRSTMARTTTGTAASATASGPPCPADHNNSATAAGPWTVDSVMLFDLESDPTESTNLASSQPDLVRRLTALVQAINASAVDSRGVCAPHEPQQSPALHNGTCTPWLV
ncbi:hypothetical protein EMIHUDRAFT_457393 [Emiliania huxleyi CCMP1516]|uniref:Sulfatase N-terminal domain-containing protein n=2 Tax=Emiliania huxleyi TaxID=2903 RepID=A0A0D3JRU6_EMIH1|nr:hypothetical protein EMIHUDRAFT_457393 [Emiliania huxleyi CCMP1516]EOD26231.1 hypothetical protein EMIHUDRAFT_457393 [Emiliania huxleyi CCMP1516]|eukprot:XP_005778660.1 hypothetical protein EMIHUDRAFT_457393 [Emiliania huxleyi CCMP1516]